MQSQHSEIHLKNEKQSDSKMDQGIQNCLNCFKVCEETLSRCLTANNHKDSNHLILLKTCAEICNTSAKFMMMNSKFHPLTCDVCSKVCLECAESCEVTEDDSMKDCVEACRKCAESCGKMAKMGH